MKIKYKKKSLIFELLSGLFWIGIAIDGIVGNENVRWTKYVLLLLGLVYLTTFIFKTRQQYLTIENGMIKKNILFNNNEKINLNDITQIMEYQGEYNLITDQTLLKFNPELIDANSYDILKRILSELDLPSDKTPFPKENNEIQPPQI